MEIRMSEKEIKRVEQVERAIRKEITIKEMSELIKVSYRQGRSILKRCKKEGVMGLAHRGRGRISNRGYPKEVKESFIDLCEGKCKELGPTMVADKYEEIRGIKVSEETARKWMIERRIFYKRRKRQKPKN